MECFSGSIAEVVDQRSQMVDADLHPVTGLQEYSARCAAARGSSCRDHIAGPQRKARAQVRNLFRDRENHVRTRRVLHQFLVHPQTNPEILDVIDVVERAYPGTEWERAVETFLAYPIEAKWRIDCYAGAREVIARG